VAVGGLFAVTLAGPAHADSTRNAEWYATFLKFDRLHAISQGQGAIVAVIDTGVDASHPDLSGNVLPGLDGWSEHRDGRADTVGHGTAMASMIAGHGHGAGDASGVLGVAPRAKILPIGAYPPGTDDFSAADVGVAIRYAVDHGAQVICLAFGGSGDPEIEEAVEYAQSKGVPLVASAGNRPRDHSVVFPAAYTGVIAVSAVDRSGAFAADVSVSGFPVVLSAPGVGMVAAVPGGKYSTTDGTSNATALVAGIVALVKSVYPQLNGVQIYQRLTATAVDKGPPGHDDQYGYGVVDPLAALTRTLPGPSASASAAAAVPPPALAGGRSTGTKVLLTVLLLAGYAVLLAGIVVLVIWLVRRRRRRARPPVPAPAPPVVPQVDRGADDAYWRHPDRGGSP
jgi:type VII secretion-associated serine protease mycosin